MAAVDIFSLGVVLYELLAGRRPFRAETRSELLEQIVALEAKPPRQIDDRIPKELDRICLKAMSKRASERYTTAKDMADDLRHFRQQAGTIAKSETRPAPGTGSPSCAATAVHAHIRRRNDAWLPTGNHASSFRKAYGHSTRTIRTSFWNCCSALGIATVCRTASAFGRSELKRRKSKTHFRLA